MQSSRNSYYWKHIYLTFDWITNYYSCSPCSPYRSSSHKVFLAKGVLKICNTFTGEQPCRSLISRNLLCSFIEITLRCGWSPVNLLHIFKRPFPKNTSAGVLQSLRNSFNRNLFKQTSVSNSCAKPTRNIDAKKFLSANLLRL